MRSQQKKAGLLLKQAQMLIPRLERLTPDSSWAHRASGCRGSLLRLSQRVEAHVALGWRLEAKETYDLAALEEALNLGYYILREAARERYR